MGIPAYGDKRPQAHSRPWRARWTGVEDLGTLFGTLLTIALGMIVGVALTKQWRGGW
jgi:hypothetical protein